jgi:hypothetical protein
MVADPLRDAILGAGEERTNTVIFHIDAKCCDYMDLFVYAPFVFNDLSIEDEYELTNGEPTRRLYRAEKNGKSTKRIEIDTESDILWAEQQASYDLLRLRHSLSLWPEWNTREIGTDTSRDSSRLELERGALEQQGRAAEASGKGVSAARE